MSAPAAGPAARGAGLSNARRVGVLLVNLGTPDAPTPWAVGRYLREFLSDPRVLDIPAPLRAALVYGVIVPFRSFRSAAAYRQIWTPEGSPLLVHGTALRDALAKRLGDRFVVELAMRYGRPAIAPALARLAAADVARTVVVPLFPQYAGSSGGSALEATLRAAGARWNVPELDLVGPFYGDPGFRAAQAAVAREALSDFDAEHVLMSFHGLPERQVRRSDPTGSHCLARPDCCDAPCPANRYCYRAHCFATARHLAADLGLPPERWSVAFQSRLGRGWLEPFTDRVLPELAARGVRRLAVACPAFVADCLETLEEIGLRAREQWSELGGEALRLVPSLNAHPRWVEALADLVRRTLPEAATGGPPLEGAGDASAPPVSRPGA